MYKAVEGKDLITMYFIPQSVPQTRKENIKNVDQGRGTPMAVQVKKAFKVLTIEMVEVPNLVHPP